MQAAMLERPSDNILLKTMSHISLTREPSAPTKAPKSYVENLAPDEDLIQKEQEQDELGTKLKAEFGAIKRADEDSRNAYRRLSAAVKAAKVKRTARADTAYREKHFRSIGTTEIEWQGKGFREEAPYVKPVIRHQLPERTAVQEMLCKPIKASDSDGIDSSERRILVVDALMALCQRREDRPGRRRVLDSDADSAGAVNEEAEFGSSDMSVDEKPIEDPFPMLLDSRQCPVCIGDSRLSDQQRTRQYHNIWNMWDHAEKHFQGVADDKPYVCNHPKCSGMLLNDVKHFKNHCAVKHNSRLRG